MFGSLTKLGLPDETLGLIKLQVRFLIISLVITAVVGLVFYLLEAIAGCKMAKSAQIKNPWLAFIPVANGWVYGTLAEKYKKEKRHKIRPFRHNFACFRGNSAYGNNSAYNIYGNFNKGNYGVRA